jgi:exopolyphosphatase/guanosine-5'-triphosphate,3'-diphosphate pyrophosphatase
MAPLASIEIGSNSIRMLIAEKGNSDTPLKPVLRRRAITRLGEDFNREEIGTIKPGPMLRSIGALKDLFGIASECGVSSPIVIATGVVRKAGNRNDFIAMIAERLGHTVKIVSGQEEADLTVRGVLSSLNHRGEPLVIFDLGGGSTEFIWANNRETKSISIELGAVVLTEDYLITDPPKDEEIYHLIKHIEDTFRIRLDPLRERGKGAFSIIGTGGTIVTLAAMIYGIAEDDYNETKINGLVIRRKDVGLLFEKMKRMTRAERLNLKGLENGREDIILAGSLMVMKIMDYFEKHEIILSYSDLLEGILINHMEGEKNG